MLIYVILHERYSPSRFGLGLAYSCVRFVRRWTDRISVGCLDDESQRFFPLSRFFARIIIFFRHNASQSTTTSRGAVPRVLVNCECASVFLGGRCWCDCGESFRRVRASSPLRASTEFPWVAGVRLSVQSLESGSGNRTLYHDAITTLYSCVCSNGAWRKGCPCVITTKSSKCW